MKDPKPVSPTPKKTKPGLLNKKAKMPAKKIKEPKLSVPKVPKGTKKNQNSLDKKTKTVIKEESKDAPLKRKRGRPRNDDRPTTTKTKEPKGPVVKTEIKQQRKRKSPQNGSLKPSKKLKVCLNMNGKTPPPSHKPPPPTHCSNGGVANKKGGDLPPTKTVTFHPNTKSEALSNGGTPATKPFKAATKSVKSILKNDPPKEKSLFPPPKLHPQRMASLDALAKMHVICIPDRKPPPAAASEHSSSPTKAPPEPPFTKSLTHQCHERIQFDLKKESKDSKGNLVHKQINYVKEKQQVFVSHSVEQSVEQKTKKSKLKTKEDQNATATTKSKGEKRECLKSAKSSTHVKAASSKKKDKLLTVAANNHNRSSKKTTKKVEQTKSEVKVKETIRMQKTCTYQSVTTVNGTTTTNSSVIPMPSHVGLTTNYSKTKKTVVTDQECNNKRNNKVNFSSGSFCVTSESPCSHHSDYYKFHHAHSTPPLIPFAHVHRTTDSSPSSSGPCDGGKSFVHRFGHHQQAVIYSPSAECSCCCSNSIVQNLHDSCILRKSIVYPPSGFSPDACCHPYHRPSPPCEPSPLDLSLASTTSVETTPHPLCCAGEVLLVRSTPCCRVPPKREKSPPKKQFAHGWSWKGKPRQKMITLTNDSTPCPRMCYPSVQHEEGDVINEKDCVLLRSGPKDTDLPYVAKVAAFWENPDDGEMMMSLLWYYRPEHTDQGRKPGHMEDEVFASRHKDVNSIACIEDKCYVLTYNEYCRYRASLTMDEETYSIASLLVPAPSEGYPRKPRLPVDPVSSDIVFVCRFVYDFRQKRTLKNPT